MNPPFGSGMKYLYIAGGLLFFALGSVGAFLPLLPTTPFLLLSVYCFSRSSERLHRWLSSTRIYQKYVAEFIETRSMTWQTKARLLVLSTLVLAFSFWRLSHLGARIVLVLLTIYMYYYFFAKIKNR